MAGKIKRKNIIAHKLKEINESTAIIDQNFPRDFDEFSRLGLVKDGIYKKVEFCIENALNICSIISADLNLGIPSDEIDIIENLEKNKILSKELAIKIKEMKGFRNILVHKYGKIEDEIAFENIEKGLEDFEKFLEEIEKILRKF